MEISQFIGFSESSGMEDPCFISQWPFNLYDDQLNMEAVAYGDNTLNLYANATPAFDHYKPIMEPSPRPAKQLKTSSWNSCISSMTNQNTHYASHPSVVNPKEEGIASSKTTIGFTSDTSPASHVQLGIQNHHSGGSGLAKMMDATKLTTPQDHILAERKRREKLSQRFIALSALVPGLKKMDKASILGDAIKHLASLQEKVKTLEKQTIKRSNIGSVVLVKRYEVFADGGEMSLSDGSLHEQLPEIEARFCGKDVLIRVHCEKKTGLVEDILVEIQKQHLSVVNTTAMTFANCALDVTVVAQMDQQFTMTMKDLVKNLHTAFKRFM